MPATSSTVVATRKGSGSIWVGNSMANLTYTRFLKDFVMCVLISNAGHVVFYNIARWWNEGPLWIPSFGVTDVVIYIGGLLLMSPFIYAFCIRIEYEARYRR